VDSSYTINDPRKSTVTLDGIKYAAFAAVLEESCFVQEGTTSLPLKDIDTVIDSWESTGVVLSLGCYAVELFSKM